jgi:GMP synthase-like glutamine amidotransferase
MRPGDRLLPTPQHGWRSYTPHAPATPVDARVVKVFGSESVRYAGQNQIVVINKGTRDGIETGHVLMVQAAGRRIQDATNGNATVRLPDERNGLAMVFRPFERASYALIMNITQPVQAGDRLVNPQ